MLRTIIKHLAYKDNEYKKNKRIFKIVPLQSKTQSKCTSTTHNPQPNRFVSLIKMQELIRHLQINFDTIYFINANNYNQSYNSKIIQKEGQPFFLYQGFLSLRNLKSKRD